MSSTARTRTSSMVRSYEVRSPLEISGAQNENQDPDPDMSLPLRARQPLQCRRPLPPPRTAIAAVLLLTGGVLFLSLGLSVFYASLDIGGKGGGEPKDRGIALLVLGGIMFIPGSYASTILLGAWQGWDGYDYAQVPSYDD